MIQLDGNLGNKIKELRLNASLNQQELAEGIITRSYLSQIESGKVMPSINILEGLSKKLGCTLKDLNKPPQKSVRNSMSSRKILKTAESHIISNDLKLAQKNITQFENGNFEELGIYEDGIYQWVKGIIAKNEEDYTLAERYFKQSISDFSTAELYEDMIRSYNSLANLRFQQEGYELEVLSFMNQCYENILDYKISGYLKTDTLLNLGIVHGKLKEYFSSLRFLEMALENNKSTSNYYKHGNILMALGICKKNIEDIKGAEKYYKEALKFFDVSDDQSNLAGTNINLGILFREKNDLDIAITHLKQGISIYKTQKEKSDQIYAEYQLAKTYFVKKDLNTSKEKIHELLGLNSNIETKLYSLLGDIHFEEKLYEQALHYYKEAANLENSVDLNKKIGLVFYKMSNYNQSADYFIKSIDIEETDLIS